MNFISKEHFFKNGWDCIKCDKMTEHIKEGKGAKAKLICVDCGSQTAIHLKNFTTNTPSARDNSEQSDQT